MCEESVLSSSGTAGYMQIFNIFWDQSMTKYNTFENIFYTDNIGDKALH